MNQPLSTQTPPATLLLTMSDRLLETHLLIATFKLTNMPASDSAMHSLGAACEAARRGLQAMFRV